MPIYADMCFRQHNTGRNAYPYISVYRAAAALFARTGIACQCSIPCLCLRLLVSGYFSETPEINFREIIVNTVGMANSARSNGALQAAVKHKRMYLTCKMNIRRLARRLKILQKCFFLRYRFRVKLKDVWHFPIVCPLSCLSIEPSELVRADPQRSQATHLIAFLRPP